MERTPCVHTPTPWNDGQGPDAASAARLTTAQISAALKRARRANRPEKRADQAVSAPRTGQPAS